MDAPDPIAGPIGHPLVRRPSTGYVFATSWPVATGDIDGRLHLRLDGVARYIQEAGAANLVDAGEADAHPHWIVNRTVIDVVEPLVYPDVVHLHRWCSALSTRWCTMRVDLEGAAGGRIETEGFWIAMNAETLTPMRVSDSLIATFAETAEDHRVRWRPWLTDRSGGGDAEAGGSGADVSLPFALRRTDIDLFDHVTNAAYWHAVHEVTALHPDVCTPPYRAVVEYRRPIRHGEAVTIVVRRRGDRVHAALTVDGAARALVALQRR